MNDKKIPKILIADDNEFFSKVLSNELIINGFDVETAVDGNEAIQKANTMVPDVVLLDLIMPVKNGFDTLKEMKKSAKLLDTKIIIFSNLGQAEDIEEAKKLGAVDYVIKKDFSLSAIVEKVESLLLSKQ